LESEGTPFERNRSRKGTAVAIIRTLINRRSLNRRLLYRLGSCGSERTTRKKSLDLEDVVEGILEPQNLGTC